VGVLGVGPGREARQHVYLTKEAADDLVAVLLGAQVIEIRQDTAECSLDIEDDPLGVILPLLLKATLMFEEFFAVEIGK
jgi:hypothetical protein